jgi:hypothetical protein
MEVLDLISRVVVLATLVSAIIAGGVWLNNRKNTREEKLADEWNRFSSTVPFTALSRWMQDPVDRILRNDIALREVGIFLRMLEDVGRRSNASASEWDRVLSLEDHARVQTFIRTLLPVIMLARETDFPFPEKFWNGDRTRASHYALRAFVGYRWKWLRAVCTYRADRLPKL